MPRGDVRPDRTGQPIPESQRDALARGREARAKRRELERQKRIKAGKPAKRTRSGPEMELTRAEQLARGIITVRELDTEELARQKCRSSDGSFAGPFRDFPSHIVKAMDLEFLRRGAELIRSGYVPAIEMLLTLSQRAESENVRLSAIREIMERIVGKVPDRLVTADLTPHSKVQEQIERDLAKLFGIDNNDIVEGELVGDDEE